MSEHRNTPYCVVRPIQAFAPIGLDPCSNATSVVAPRLELILPNKDGLTESWDVLRAGEIVFVNTDWRKHLVWVRKVLREAQPTFYWGPAYTETAWAKLLLSRADAVCFWGCRVAHVDPCPEMHKKTGKPKSDSGSMWPTMLVAVGCSGLRNDFVTAFGEHFSQHGTVMVPWMTE